MLAWGATLSCMGGAQCFRRYLGQGVRDGVREPGEGLVQHRASDAAAHHKVVQLAPVFGGPVQLVPGLVRLAIDGRIAATAKTPKRRNNKQAHHGWVRGWVRVETSPDQTTQTNNHTSTRAAGPGWKTNSDLPCTICTMATPKRSVNDLASQRARATDHSCTLATQKHTIHDPFGRRNKKPEGRGLVVSATVRTACM